MSQINGNGNSFNNNVENNDCYYPAISRSDNILNNKINTENQNDLLFNLKNQIDQIFGYINSNQSPETVEKIKSSIFDELNLISSQLTEMNDKLKYLSQENLSLKNMIKNKDEILSDYEITLQKSAEKLLQLQKINEQLSNTKIISNNDKKLDSYCPNSPMSNNYNFDGNNSCHNNFNNNSNNNLNYNYYYDYKNEINPNCNFQEIQNQNNNNCCDSSEVYTNNYLLELLNQLKLQLNSIENEYNKKVAEKDIIIGKLNKDLKKRYEIYNLLNKDMEKNLKLLEKENNELKTGINLLNNEKELLLDEKEKCHNEIISLREKISHFTNGCDHEASIKEFKNKQNEICCKFQTKEKKYIEDILKLHQSIVNREKEIETLKEKYNKIIRNLQLEIEELKNRFNNFKYTPEKNSVN